MITDTVCEEDPNNWGDPDKHKNVRNPPKNVRTQGTDTVHQRWEDADCTNLKFIHKLMHPIHLGQRG